MNPVFAREAEVAVQNVPFKDKVKMVLKGKKIYLSHEKREGWLGELPFYLFFCFSCGNFAKDYPHGYSNYLNCPHCGAYDKLKSEDAYSPAK